MEKAVNKLIYVSADEQLRYELDMREKWELDHLSRWNQGIRDAKEEGIAKGIAKGRAEGIMKGRTESQAELIRNMKESGMSIEEIAKLTKLTVKEVEQFGK